MKHALRLIVIMTMFFANSCFAQETKGGTNLLMMKGERFKEGETVVLSCDSDCYKVDKEKSVVSFVLNGKLGERNVRVTMEVPVLSGIKKLKLDKDGDLGNDQKMTIEVFGKNPAVDKDIYEIQDEADEAIISIMRFDEEKGELEGTFTSKYFDSATAVKKLSATCHFLLVKQKM